MHKVSQAIELGIGCIRRSAKDNIKGWGDINKTWVFFLDAPLGAVLAGCLVAHRPVLDVLPHPYRLVVVSSIGDNVERKNVA